MNIEVFPAIYCLKIRIDFLRFSNYAIYPPKGSPDAAGYDLYSMEWVIVLPSSIRIIPTDVSFKTPKGYFGKIHFRCSLLCSVQMSAVESLIPTTEVQSMLYFSIFQADILN